MSSISVIYNDIVNYIRENEEIIVKEIKELFPFIVISIILVSLSAYFITFT